MAMEPVVKVALGSASFLVFWVLAVFPAVPFLPIGRTAGSLLGAMLMVLLGVTTADAAYAAVDLPILGLLFGTMVVSVYLERADMFRHLGRLLSWRSQGGRDLLCRTCAVSALASALFTNDTCCVVLTEFILKVARQNNLPPRPFLLALASGANIGSAATPIGNPQNLVIAVQSGISFGQFVFGILPATLVGSVVNAGILLGIYWNQLDGSGCKAAMVEEVVAAPTEVVEEEDVTSHRFSPATMSHLLMLRRSQSRGHGAADGAVPVVPVTTAVDHHHQNPVKPPAANGVHHRRNGNCNCKGDDDDTTDRYAAADASSDSDADIDDTLNSKAWKACVYLITLGMLAALLLGLNMSWSAITAALALIVLDFKDARPCLEKVSYPLLLFFCGMFITVDGFNKTGIPSAFWEFMEPYARVDTAAGTATLAAVVLLLSNVASNVPTVLLLGARGRVRRGDLPGRRDQRVARPGVDQHRGGQPLAAGLRRQPHRVRAGAPVAAVRVHALLLQPPPVRVPGHARRHRHRTAAHQNLLMMMMMIRLLACAKDDSVALVAWCYPGGVLGCTYILTYILLVSTY